MLRFGSFEVWIQVDGEILPAYEIKVDQGSRKVSGWIPSEADKCFSVHWRNTENIFDTGGYVFLDGSLAGGRLIFKTGRNHVQVNNVATSATSARPFKFAPVSCTDDQSDPDTLPTRVGEIQLALFRAEIGPCIEQKPRTISLPTDNLKVQERSKKIGLHCVRLGEEVLAAQPPLFSYNILESLVTFSFTYRPLAMLECYGIAPSTITNVIPRSSRASGNKRKVPPSGQDVKMEHPNDNESIQVQQQLSNLKAEMHRLEARLTKKQRMGPIKREQHEPEVIDLTEEL